MPEPRTAKPSLPASARRASRPALVPALAALAAAAAASPGGAEARSWRFAQGFGPVDEPRAVAFDPRSGRVALGGEDGARLGPPKGRGRSALRRGPVRDLAFEPGGALLAATDEGLYRVGTDGRVVERSPGPGASAREVARVATAGGLALAATGDGLFLSVSTGADEDAPLRWRHADAGFPAGPARAVAVRGPKGERELFALLEAGLYRARLSEGGARRPLREVRRVALPGVGATDALRDLARLPDGRLLVLNGRTLVVISHAGEAAAAHRPPLPPGVAPRRVAAEAGAVFLATERGLLRAERPSGPFRRLPPPAGRADVRALAAGGGRVFAAAARGLLVGSPRGSASGAQTAERAGGRVGDAPGEPVPWAGEPSVAAVQRAALRHQGLGPEKIRALRRGVRRRAWLPDLDIDAGYGGERERDHDIDDAHTASPTHDRARSHDRDFDVGIALEWELGNLVFHPDALDVSDEAREVIELRDDVLDEITQLYFERRRALRELARVLGERGAEARERAGELRLRADELAAGLDAWTGGWWSRRVPPRSARGGPLSPPSQGRKETP